MPVISGGAIPRPIRTALVLVAALAAQASAHASAQSPKPARAARTPAAPAVAPSANTPAVAPNTAPAIGTPPAAGSTTIVPIGPYAMVRCLAERDMACLQITFDRPVDANGMPKRIDTARVHWPGYVGATRLIGPGLVRLGFDSTRKVRVLLAVDISGSMKGEGIAFVRSALRGFLAAMPKTGIELALVPFDSRSIAPRFSAAQFKPSSGAMAQLEALPAPTIGNTALYSAIAEGLKTLDRPGASSDASVLVVLTDGVNDIGHSIDDPGLLGGMSGREEARRLIAASKHQVWLVGAGSGVDAAELQTLAGKRANATAVAMDPGALLSLLEQIRLSLATQYTLVYGIPSSVAARLGRRPFQLSIAGDTTIVPRWRPTLVASPPYAGVADPKLLSSDLRVLAENTTGSVGERGLIGGALLAVLLAIYAVFWRMGGAELTAPGAAQPSGESAKKSPKKAAAESSLRRDVVDAPPRSPQDVTNDEAA